MFAFSRVCANYKSWLLPYVEVALSEELPFGLRVQNCRLGVFGFSRNGNLSHHRMFAFSRVCANFKSWLLAYVEVALREELPFGLCVQNCRFWV